MSKNPNYTPSYFCGYSVTYKSIRTKKFFSVLVECDNPIEASKTALKYVYKWVDYPFYEYGISRHKLEYPVKRFIFNAIIRK